MFRSGLTLQERQLKLLLKWWIGLFFVAGVCFAAFPFDVVYWLNSIGHTVLGWQGRTMPQPSEHFWQVLAVSLLAVLTYAAISAHNNIRQNYYYVKIIILAKLVSTCGFIVAFVLDTPYFAYLAGAAIDFLILVMTLICYARVSSSRAI